MTGARLSPGKPSSPLFRLAALLSLLGAASGCVAGAGTGPAPVPPVDAPSPPRPDATAGTPDAAPPMPMLPDAAPPPVDAMGVDTSPALSDTGPAAECSPPSSVLCSPLAPLPATLRETGFFPMLGNLDVLPPNVHPFLPSIQLWSDGLHKKRQVILPKGKKIDIGNREAWVFPIGTIFVKTFLSDGPAGMKPVETRIIRRTDNPDIFEQYTFDVYKWNDAGTDATLINIDERTPAPVTIGGRNLTHQIPSREDCKRCHTTNDTNVIGFDEVRLNAPLTAGGKTQLETFAEAGFFSQAPPSPAAQISDPDMLTERVKKYVYGNCFHCHNGNDSQAFDMRSDGFVEAVVRQETMASGTAPGIRVVPGNPDMSVLYRQMTRMNLMMGFNPMPLVGVQIADPEGLSLVRQWIMSLQ
jgi:hypothetical protein